MNSTTTNESRAITKVSTFATIEVYFVAYTDTATLAYS